MLESHPESKPETLPDLQTPTAVHTAWGSIPVEAMSPHLSRQFITGQNVMIARVLLAKGAHVPMHAHPNEQVVYILEGALKFVLEDREIIVRAGEVLCIPANLPHEAFALEDTIDLDIFNPPRQDWLTGDDSYLRAPALPTAE